MLKIFLASVYHLKSVVLIAFLLISLNIGFAQSVDQDSKSLIDKINCKSGLCLVVGAKDPGFVSSLVSNNSFYVQVNQPDAKLATSWAMTFAASKEREKISIRNSGFDTNVYGSDLFNLIVLFDSKIITDAKLLTELNRIIVPGGILAIADKAFKTEFEKSNFQKSAGLEGWVLLTKKLGSVGEIKPTDTLRWRAGGRWDSGGEVIFGNGKMVYREEMNTSSGKNTLELICRDAFNGRLLWKIQEKPNILHNDARKGFAISESGKLFAGLGSDLVCIETETGKVLATIKVGGRPSDVRIHKEKYLIVDGSILDINDYKELGKFANGSIAIGGDVIFSSREGKFFEAFQIPDCKLLWKVDVSKDQPNNQFGSLFCSDTALHVKRSWPAATLSSMDMATGKTLWVYPPEPRPKVGGITAYPIGDKLYINYDEPSIKEVHDFTVMEVEANTGKILRDKIYAPGKQWAGGCWGPRIAGDYLLYHHNIWFNLKTAERTNLVLFRPKCQQGPLPFYGLSYQFAGCKGGAVKGIAALAPSDMVFNDNLGGKILKTYAPISDEKVEVAPNDWPMFRGNLKRGNSTVATIGKSITQKWVAEIGLGKQTYGAMDSERTGLTQAVCVGKIAVVSDIEGQRIVGLDTESGKVKWIFPVGGRVEISPSIFENVCLFGSKNGWVYCLDLNNGNLIYQFLIAPQERFIGGQDSLESMWPCSGDVLIVDGIAYASAGIAQSIHGGLRIVAFKAKTGEVIWSKVLQNKATLSDQEIQPGLLVLNQAGKCLEMNGMSFELATGKTIPYNHDKSALLSINIEDWLATNNRRRWSADMGGVAITGGCISGRLIAFSEQFGIGNKVAQIEKSVLFLGPTTIYGNSADGKVKWSLPPTEMVVDDFVVTPDSIYVVGHYEKGEGSAELWVVSPTDGKVLSTQKIDVFPCYNGMSIAGNKIFIASREGKLVCLEAK